MTIRPTRTAMEFGAELPSAAPLEKVDLSETARRKKTELLRSVEDDLLSDSMAIMRATLKFADIDPGTADVPESWFEDFKGDGVAAKRALRVANAAWMCAKEAPVGLAVATKIGLGIIKARSAEQHAPRSLNVAFITNNNSIQQVFDEVEVDEK